MTLNLPNLVELRGTAPTANYRGVFQNGSALIDCRGYPPNNVKHSRGFPQGSCGVSFLREPLRHHSSCTKLWKFCKPNSKISSYFAWTSWTTDSDSTSIQMGLRLHVLNFMWDIFRCMKSWSYQLYIWSSWEASPRKTVSAFALSQISIEFRAIFVAIGLWGPILEQWSFHGLAIRHQNTRPNVLNDRVGREYFNNDVVENRHLRPVEAAGGPFEKRSIFSPGHDHKWFWSPTRNQKKPSYFPLCWLFNRDPYI